MILSQRHEKKIQGNLLVFLEKNFAKIATYLQQFAKCHAADKICLGNSEAFYDFQLSSLARTVAPLSCSQGVLFVFQQGLIISGIVMNYKTMMGEIWR